MNSAMTHDDQMRPSPGHTLRRGTMDDCERMLALYTHYVENTSLTLEEEPPVDFDARFASLLAHHYPWFIVEEGSTLCGYAYAKPFNARSGYRYCFEWSVYLDPSFQGCGFGKQLYHQISTSCVKQNIHVLMAVLSKPLQSGHALDFKRSYQFHTRMGFLKTGHLRKIGYKFNRWHDILYLQRVLV